MRFVPLSLAGAYLIELEEKRDERGFFARAFCVEEFAAQGLCTRYVQSNISYSARRGTVRGMHYQAPPWSEVKVVRCVRGAIYDVIVDLREESPTYLQHVGVELNDRNRSALYIPELFAHGFQTLSDDAEVEYQMSAMYAPEAARGLRYDDPALDIRWPLPAGLISEQDRTRPLLPVLSGGHV